MFYQGFVSCIKCVKLNLCYWWKVNINMSFLEDEIIELLRTCDDAFMVVIQFSSVAQSCPTLVPIFMSIELVHPTISSSIAPFSSCPQSFPASGSSQMSHLFTSSSQSIGVSFFFLFFFFSFISLFFTLQYCIGFAIR